MKKYFTIVIILLSLLGLFACTTNQIDTSQINKEKTFDLAIVSIVEIEPIIELRKGFREVFEQSPFIKEKKLNISEYNSQGDQSLLNQIVDKLATNKPNLIYVLGTPAAQAIQKRIPDVLLVQGAVTDPVTAGLANSWSGSGKKYIATSDLPPIAKQLELIQNLTPKVVKLGIIYNPSESNSVAVVSRIREYINQAKLKVSLVERPIANSGDAATVMQTLLGNIDAIYLPPDNTAHSALAVIGKFAKEQKLPFYTTTTDALKVGALATLSLDFHQLGKESAQLALDALTGQDPAKIAIQVNQNPLITINGKVANALGLEISKFRNVNSITILE